MFVALSSFPANEPGARGSFQVLLNGDVLFVQFTTGALNLMRATSGGIVTALTTSGRVQDFVLLPDQSRVVFSTISSQAPFNVSSILLSAGATTLLSSSASDSVATGALLAVPSSRFVVFVSTDSALRSYPSAVAADGSTAPLRLSLPGTDLTASVALAGASRAVFWAGQALVSASLTNISDRPGIATRFYNDVL